MTKIIGLTGGIGSGKSTVAAYLISKNYKVYVADTEAKKLMEIPAVIAEVQNIFDENVIFENVLNRKKIAEIVFSNPEKLKKLNALIHPKVKEHFNEWVAKHKNQKFVFKEVAILFETGGDKECDLVILVTAPIDIRIKRVTARDKTTKEAVMNRISVQMSDEEKSLKSDYIITNLDIQDTHNQIDNILKKMNKM